MAVAVRTGSVRRGKGAVKRLSNAVAEALPVLAELERLEELPDRIGRFVVQPGEEVDADRVAEFLRTVQAEAGQQELTIIVVGRQAVD